MLKSILCRKLVLVACAAASLSGLSGCYVGPYYAGDIRYGRTWRGGWWGGAPVVAPIGPGPIIVTDRWRGHHHGGPVGPVFGPGIPGPGPGRPPVGPLPPGGPIGPVGGPRPVPFR